MEHFQQRQSSQQDSNQNSNNQNDLISDPNLLLAVAMVKSISSLIDNNQSSEDLSKSNDDKSKKAGGKQEIQADKKGQANSGTGSKSNQNSLIETIDLQPMQELTSLISERKMLNRNQVKALTSCIQQIHYEIQEISENHPQRLKEILNLAYHGILNAYSYSQSKNYLDSSALNNLQKQLFELLTKILEILSDDNHQIQPQLFNLTLPQIIKILTSLQTQEAFNEAHFLYLQEVDLRLETQSLNYLNTHLAKYVAQLYDQPQKSSMVQKTVKTEDQKDVDMIELSQNQQSYSNDDIDLLSQALDFVPIDQAVLNDEINQQLQNKVLNKQANVNENEGQDSSKIGASQAIDSSFVERAGKIISDLKIHDLLTSAINILVGSLASKDDYESRVLIDTSLISQLCHNSAPNLLKNQLLAQFIQTDIFQLIQDTQNSLKLLLQESQSDMQIDSVAEESGIEALNHVKSDKIKEFAITLAKLLEIAIRSQDITSNKEFDKFIQDQQNFKYIIQVTRSQTKLNKDVKAPLLSLINSILRILVEQYESQKATLSIENQESFVIKATNLIRAQKILGQVKVKQISQPKETQKSATKPDKSQKPPLSQSQPASSVRTRGQIKKEQVSTSQETQENKEEEQKQQIDTSNKQVKVTNLTAYDIQEAFKCNEDQLLKSSLSFLSVISTDFTSQQMKLNSQVNLSKKVLKNLFDIFSHSQAVASRLIYGVLSNFTKSSFVFSEQSLKAIQQIISKQLDNITQSNVATTFLIKLMILMKNQALYIYILRDLITSQEKWNIKKTPVKQTADLYNNQTNFKKFLLIIASLVLLDPVNELKTVKNDLIQGFIVPQLQSNSTHFVQILYFLELLLTNQKVIQAQFKSVLFQFLTKMHGDESTQSQLDTYKDQIDQSLESMKNNKDQYDPEMLEILRNHISIQKMIEIVQNNYLHGTKSDKLQEKAQHILKTINKIYHQDSLTTDQLIANLNNDITSTLTHGKLNSTFKEATDNLQTMVEITNTMPEEGTKVLYDQLDVITKLSNRSLNLQIKLLKPFINIPESLQQNGLDSQFMNLINQYLLLNNSKIRGRIQSQFKNLNSEDNKFVSLLIDSQLLAKQISSQLKQDFDEIFFQHCFSQTSTYQEYVSINILLKSLWNNLSKLLALKEVEKEPDVVNNISTQLLKISNESPQLVYLDTTNSLNNAFLDKLITQSKQKQTNQADYSKFKQLHISMNTLFATNDFLFKLLQQNEKEQESTKDVKKFMSCMQSELTYVFAAANYQSIEERKQLHEYFTQSSNTQQFTELVFQSQNQNQNVIQTLWDYTIRQIELSFKLPQDEMEINEKKGGMQMTIAFGNNNKAQSQSQPTVANKKQLTYKEKVMLSKGLLKKDDKDQVMSDETSKKSSLQLDPVASKLINFICDLIALEKDKPQENQQLSAAIKQAILTQENLNNYVAQLIELDSLPNLKKLLSTLFNQGDIENQNQDQQQQLRAKFSQMLAGTVRTSTNRNSQFLVNIIDLALIVFDDNTSLMKFIQKNILCLSTLKQSPTKLLILDLLCQLGLQKYSKQGDSKLRYSIQQIQELRKKHQQDQTAKQQKKKQALQLEQKQNDESLQDLEKLSSSQQLLRKPNDIQDDTIEGYKQDDVNKEDSKTSQKYMEKPSDVCTYTLTGKNFSNQHWYFCYTCNLTGSSGCCAVCARKCHKGHQVVYSRKSNFFCDCGDSGKCNSMKVPVEEKPKEAAPESQSKRSHKRSRKNQDPVNMMQPPSYESSFNQQASQLFSNILGGSRPSAAPGRDRQEPRSFLEQFQQQRLEFEASSGLIPPYQALDELEEELQANKILQQFGGIFEKPLNEGGSLFSRYGGGPQGAAPNEFRRLPGQFNFMDDESSEDDDDEDDENNDHDIVMTATSEDSRVSIKQSL